jgi:hypothetical protein
VVVVLADQGQTHQVQLAELAALEH